ncbi:LacI family DNA-binding transcriptional regulator [Leifsonia sp. NPDC014704]|uniref:LacI family DNA-binding transcriptional regulator n=1 Tax=Leifsonia sp. NPDC014704 TaxID=3364123 RepID=UPI0036F4584E
MRDVALRAGVSTGTVSNVLNRAEIVSPEVVARVRAAIDELGYVRNDVARWLRAGDSTILGLIVPDVRSPFFAEIARGVQSSATERGLSMLLGSSDGSVALEQEHIATFARQRVRGLLITPLGREHSALSRFATNGAPVVLVDAISDDDEFSCVYTDDAMAGRLAAEHLIASGRSRLAFVGGPLAFHQIAERLRGASQAVSRHSDVGLEITLVEEPTLREGRRIGDALVSQSRSRRPDAIMAANDLVAIGLMQALISAPRVRVPEDLAVIGFDDVELAQASPVPLTSIRRHTDLVASTAARLLVAEAADANAATQRIVISPELVIRRSTSTADPSDLTDSQPLL